MAKVRFTFKKKMMVYLSLNVVIDDGKPILITNGSSAEVELGEGVHSIRAYVPYQGNDAYMATAQITITSDTNYDVVYSVSSMATNGVLTITEIPVSSNGASNAKVTKTKAHMNTGMIIIFVFCAVMVLSTLAMTFWAMGRY